ncbi:uncharacterized protein LOC134352383 isoform X2 [Mobula hypostoma]|uniref:uncharacterized protein LOC134352383 isoform X2 n=1 Tax=Mobula hypostoma TaxID=723540 RepID=UPI002FC3029C
MVKDRNEKQRTPAFIRFNSTMPRRAGNLLWLATSVLLLRSSEGAEPVTCGAISLCWDIASPITFTGKFYLNYNNVLDTGKIKSGSWWLEPRVEHVLHLTHATQSSTWKIYTMCPPHLEVLNGSVAEIQGAEGAKQSFLFQRNARLGCEGEVLYFLGTHDLSLAIVSADHFPLKINTVPTGLSFFWRLRTCFLKDPLCTLLLFDIDGNKLHQDVVKHPSLNITGLTPCRHYIVCVNIMDHGICAVTLTEPLPASNLSLITSNSNSVTIYWDKPARGDVDWFQLDVLLLEQNGEATESLLQSYNLTQSGVSFLVDGLPVCRQVRVSLKSACEGATVKESTNMSLVANTAPVKLVKLAQTAAADDGYKVSWSVSGDPSQVLFRVYRNGHLQLTQNRMEYVTVGIGPCTEEMFMLEVVCRTGAVADKKSIVVTTEKYQQNHGHDPPSQHTFHPSSLREKVQELEDSYSQIWEQLLSNCDKTAERILTQIWAVPSKYLDLPLAPVSVTDLIYKPTVDGGFFSWRSPPAYHGIRVQANNTLVAFTKKSYYQVSGLSACTQYLYIFQATCGPWMSEGISWVAVTGCPPEVRPSDRKSIIVLPNQIHFHIHFPWQFADYMNDPTSKAYLKLAGISRSKVRQLFLDSGKLANADVEMLHLRRGSDGVEMNVAAHIQLNSMPASLEYLLSNLGHTTVSAEGDVLFWDDEDECSSAKNDCPVGADCINTFDSFTCVCHQGYFDPDFQSRSCRDYGVFADCRMDSMKISVLKEFLVDLMQSGLQLVLNDGVCGAEEELDFYTFTVTDTKAYCGGQLEMNETHKIFKHVITNEYHSESPIIREPPLTLTVNCVYSRSSLAKMPLDVITQIRMFEPITEYNRDPLHLAIFLYKDDTFSPSTMYEESPTIQLNEDLYLEVRASPTGTSEAAFVLEVVSCWATAAADRLGRRAFQFLRDGCPVDETFRWHSVNGLSSNTRFAIKMFCFTEMVNSPIYLHCQVKICNVEAAGDCSTECSSTQIPKRQEQREGTTLHEPVTELVSTGSIALRSHPSQPEDLEKAATKCVYQ